MSLQRPFANVYSSTYIIDIQSGIFLSGVDKASWSLG